VSDELFLSVIPLSARSLGIICELQVAETTAIDMQEKTIALTCCQRVAICCRNYYVSLHPRRRLG
jgi:hypothetical protein